MRRYAEWENKVYNSIEDSLMTVTGAMVKNILLTGGAGFIGSWVAIKLV